MTSLYMVKSLKLYDEIHEMIQNGVIISAYAVEGKGVHSSRK